MQKVFGVVEVHLDLFKDDLALFFYVLGIEQRAENEVGDDIKGDGEMLVENLGVEADLFLGSESIEHAADGVHFAGDSFGGAALSTLEDHVLDEVGEAVFFGDFAAGTVANPDADGDGANVGHGLCDDHEAIGQKVLLDVARFRGHGIIVTQAERKGKTEGRGRLNPSSSIGCKKGGCGLPGGAGINCKQHYKSFSAGLSLPYSLV